MSWRPMGRMHVCASAVGPDYLLHTSGTGKARRKTCEWCGGLVRTELGHWGVFFVEPEKYDPFPPNAVEAYARLRDAERLAKLLGERYCVKWVRDRVEED